MSLGIVIKGPEGLVLAADSRITLETSIRPNTKAYVFFNNATKLIVFDKPYNNFGAVTYGESVIINTGRTANSYLPEFGSYIKNKKGLSIEAFAKEFGLFFKKLWDANKGKDTKKHDGMTFNLGGFNNDEHYGRVFQLNIPNKINPIEQHAGPEKFGISWGGERKYVDRLIRGYDNRLLDFITTSTISEKEQKELLKKIKSLGMTLPLNILPLQDCINLALFFLRTTIDAQKLSVGIRSVGDPIDIAVITRNGLEYVQKKQLKGEKEQ